MPLRPLIAICGTTGVGKSNLAVELALRLKQGGFKNDWSGAKIVNADSMQVYEGLDIITNKIPLEERKGVKHLLMDIKKPGEQYVVGQWVQDAIKLIDEIHKDNEIPIVVGGTSYWIQNLVFSDRLVGSPQVISTATKSSHKTLEELHHFTSKITDPDLLHIFATLPESPPSASSDGDAAYQLHALLNMIDPAMASRWHWRDTRRVLRSLEIIKETGHKASDIVTEQTLRTAAAKPRFRTLFLWLYAEHSILKQRLYDRVDRMIELGLLDEIRSLRNLTQGVVSQDLLNEGAPEMDYSLGIYQAIGYKEFHNYLSNPEPSQSEFAQAVDRMKLSTRQYAKRQISWIRNKLIPVAESANKEDMTAPFYLLDATEFGMNWVTNVLRPATKVMEDFLNNQELPEAKSLSARACALLTVKDKDVRPSAILEARRKIICTVCTTDESRPVMIEQGLDWELHLKTRSHKRLQKTIQKSQAQVVTSTSYNKAEC
ncbi:tRNA dimethylallyltransferase, mitochondrial [Leucoagaricus gongylophorus]